MIPHRIRAAVGFYVALVCILLVAPVAVIIWASTTTTGYIIVPPVGFSLKWYATILERAEFINAALNSVIIAVFSATIATVIGTMATLVLARSQFRGRQLVTTLFMAPIMLPSLIFGLALLLFLVQRGIPRTMLTLVIGHVIITMPFVIRFVMVSLQGIDRSVERAALSLGASPWETFRKVTFPLLRPGLVASFAFALILSFDDIAVSLFLTTPSTTTLPMQIYTYIDQSNDPLVTAVSAMAVFAAFLLLVVVERTVGIGKLFGLR